jgi:hypothetical protein
LICVFIFSKLGKKILKKAIWNKIPWQKTGLVPAVRYKPRPKKAWAFHCHRGYFAALSGQQLTYSQYNSISQIKKSQILIAKIWLF